MGRKSKKTLIKERIEELKNIFADIPAEKMKVCLPVFPRLAKMENYLEDLENQIDVVGFVEEYQNGTNQSGSKESTASRAYSTVVKNYNSLLRTLLSLLPDDARQEVSDGFDDFLQRGK